MALSQGSPRHYSTQVTAELNGIEYPVKIITSSIKVKIGITQGAIGPSTIQSP